MSLLPELAEFRRHAGGTFRSDSFDPPLTFELTDAEPLRPDTADPERQFSLVFAAPADRPFDQRIVALHNDELAADLFVVPIREHDGRRYYEAVVDRGCVNRG